jgi:hypothetical protein
MVVFWGGFLAIFFPFFLQQGIIQDQAQARFCEAMATATSDGLPALVRKLDAIATAAPSSSFTPFIQETIHVIGLLHPGSVPDQPARLKTLKASGTGNPAMAKVLQRIDILQAYYQAAIQGRGEGAVAALSDPVFAGSLLGLQAQADAAMRAHEYVRAEALARQVIEADPYSPLLANAYMILGLSATYRGEAQACVRYFQNALTITALPTIYGNTQNCLYTAYRFAKPSMSTAGDFFDEVSWVRLVTTTGLKDPQALIPAERGFLLVDKEQNLTVAADGRIIEIKVSRRIVDAATAGAGKTYLLAEDGIDLGGGSLMPLSLNFQGKPKAVKKLRSFAVDIRGDIYLLEQDFGLLRGSLTGTGSLALTVLAPVKGQLIRVDGRGNLYVLAADNKSILVYSCEGKQLNSVLPTPTAGKEANIEYFALDLLNHLYILDANSIQVFAMIDRSAGLDKLRLGAVTLDPRPQFKNLKVVGISAVGEMAATGKNDDNWVCYR